MKKLIIIGAGGHGKVCAEIAQDMNKWNEICFLDDNYPSVNKCLDFDIIGTTKAFKMFRDYDFFVAIGNNKIRAEFVNLLLNNKINVVTLIHPTAYVSKYVTIGEGTSIHQLSVINTDTTIGKGCIINTSSIVEHENKIADFVHISPNVSLGGQVIVEKLSWIGIGTTISNNVLISSNVIVGANSLVLKNISENMLVYGVPVKKM